MKIEQEKREFKPFKVVIETEEEAYALLELADAPTYNTQRAKNLGMEISNAFSNLEFDI